MTRVKRGVETRRKHKKLLARAKGLRRSKQTSVKRAREAVIHRGEDMYVGRKLRKRDLRKLWILRINAACRMFGSKYSEFINLLKKSGSNLNRKVLSEIAFENPTKIGELINTLRSKS